MLARAADADHDLIVTAVVDPFLGGAGIGLRAARDGDGAVVDTFRFPG